jgi:Concanavalin A-like lectin/glucanases superfamily/GH141 insertion domain/Right handed beta helix region
MMLFRKLLISLALTGGICSAMETQADFYVATNGKDTNPGTRQAPFAGVARARKAVRALIAKRPRKDVLVLIRGGVYRIKKPLSFGSADSGTEKHSVTWAAFPGEKPVVSGGRVITGWKQKGKLWVAEVPKVDAGKWRFRELFINGRRATRARGPNRGCFRVAKAGPDGRTSFTFRKGDLFPKLAGAELVFFHDWCTSRVTIKSVESARLIARLADAVGGLRSRWGRMDAFEKHARYYVENSAALLDAPGEWYLDEKKNLVSYMPRRGERIEKAEFVAPIATRLLEVRGKKGQPIRNLHFRGLGFEHCAWNLPKFGAQFAQASFYEHRPVRGKPGPRERVTTAVEFEMCVESSVRECRFAHLGGSGLGIRRGGHRNVISGCEFFDVAANGVMIGEGNRARARDKSGTPAWDLDPDLITKGNQLSDNLIYRCGQLFPGAIGVWAGLTDGTIIAHNEIRDLPYTGVSVGWMWNVSPTPCGKNIVEKNHIHRIMQVLSDGGGIYTLGRQPGTVLRGNYIHDIPPNSGRAESNGMFLDEGSSEFLVKDNTIHSVGKSSIRFHKARGITLRGNTLLVGHGQRPFRYNNSDPATMKFGKNTVIKAAAGKPASRRSTKGKLGSALLCDGVASHLEVPHRAELEPAQLTLEAWVRVGPYAGGKDRRRWVAGKNRNEWTDGHYGLVVSDDEVGAYLNIGGGKKNCFSAFSNSNPINQQSWQHLAMTYDAKTLRVYVDGKEVVKREVGKKRRPGKGALSIGSRPDGFTYLNGLVDEVRFYKKALGRKTIAEHARNANCLNPREALVAKWDFDDEPAQPKLVKKAAEQAGIRAPHRKRLLKQ